MGGEIGQVVVQATGRGVPPATQATSDAQLVELWLHGMSRHTQRAYRKDHEDFARAVGHPLHAVTLADVQAYVTNLTTLGLAAGSIRRKVNAVKSLLAFGHRLGYLPYDVARPLRVPPVRDTLTERILEAGQVHRMLALEPAPRNRVMLQLLYASGVRVSELVSLRWRDLRARAEGGQVTVFGKGGKTRTILLPPGTWAALTGIRGAAADDWPVFVSRKGGHLDPSQVLRLVRAAARRAGIDGPVSPHWLRHAHASHALDRGAPIHLVQRTLGHRSVSTTGAYLHARPTESSSSYLPL